MKKFDVTCEVMKLTKGYLKDRLHLSRKDAESLTTDDIISGLYLLESKSDRYAHSMLESYKKALQIGAEKPLLG